jgi:hypothetical protein
MKGILIGLGLTAILAVPAAAMAKPDEAEKRAAKQACKAERGKSKVTREAFEAKYRSLGRCVRRGAAEEEAENEAARKNAATECKSERDDQQFPQSHDGKSFDAFYGTNENLHNAFGKCVSAKAHTHKSEMDEEDKEHAEDFKNAAHECAAERRKTGTDAFLAQYGTNHNGRNAFGKCVSAGVRDSDD